MIRAVVQDGVIQPLDPLPPGWAQGKEVWVEGELDPCQDGNLDRWYQELEGLVAVLGDPEDHRRIRQALAEADRLAKAETRRTMGLPDA